MGFPRVAQQRKKSILAAEMLLQVISHDYAIGDKLPPERILAQQMAISRNTLREAIAALQLMGLIEVRHSQGNFIIALPEKSQVEGQQLQDILEPDDDLMNVTDVRMALEPGIVWLAVERMSESELMELEKRLNALERSLACSDANEYARADAEFHLYIARGSHNERLVEMLEALLVSRRSPLWHAMKQGLDKEVISRLRATEHRAIYEAIANREQLQASEAMRVHLENSMERFLIDVESKIVT